LKEQQENYDNKNNFIEATIGVIHSTCGKNKNNILKQSVANKNSFIVTIET
jgi:hypothetical protein